MAVAPGVILVGNPWDFKVRGFRDGRVSSLASSYLNAATTYTWEIRTAEGSGGSQIATGDLEYVTDSNGDYVGGPNGTNDGSQNMAVGTVYWVTLTLVQGENKFYVNYPVEAVRRLGSSPTR